MSEDRNTREAKAAASEAIGKLIGDDAAVRKGRRAKNAAAPAPPPAIEDKTTQEQE